MRSSSIRVRAAFGAGLAAAVVFGVGALWLRHAVYADRMHAAVDQAGADARSIAEAYARRGPSGPVPDSGVAWAILQDENHRPVMSTTGELEPYVAAGAVSISPPGEPVSGTVTARLGDLGQTADPLPYSGRLENRTVTLAYARTHVAGGGGAGATVYVLASPVPAEDAVAALDRGFAAGLPVAVLLVALIAWMVTGRALRPVEAIRSELADITARRLSRRVPVPGSGDEIARLAATTNATLDRLERAIDQQRRFVADAAHELRSPLANLRSSFEVATVHSGETDWPHVVRAALADTARLQELTDDLLLLARLDRTAAPRRVVDLAALVEEQVAERHHRGVDRLAARTDGPLRVRGDERQLGRLVRNLLDNALRYSDGPVEVAVTADGAEARLDVVDKGPGIPAADRERVFERFTRLDDARTRDAGGTGLGLAIVRDIATAHGGTVRIGDAEQGTRVVVRLPAAAGSGPPAGASPPTRPRDGSPRRAVAVAAALTVLVAASLVGSVRPPAADPGGAPESGGGSLVWAGGTDATHLFLLMQGCRGCGTTVLVGSDDGGATWRAVANTALTDGVDVLGPRVLLTRPVPRKSLVDPGYLVSYDAGRHWVTPVRGDPIDAVPADSSAFCWPMPYAGLAPESVCRLFVADPRTRRIRPLSSGPPLTAMVVNQVATAAGLWVSGIDPATRRPAMSISQDRGRTWVTHVFADLPRVDVEGGWAATVYLPDVVSLDGRTAFATVFDGEHWRAYLTRDGGQHGSWMTLDVEKSSNVGGRLSFVTSDGTHMLALDDGGRYLARSEDSATYRPVALGGLPFYAVVSVLPDGGYLAHTDRAIYLSDDGWAWRRVWSE